MANRKGRIETFQLRVNLFLILILILILFNIYSKESVVRQLHDILARTHPFAKLYKFCGQFYDEKKAICDKENRAMPQFWLKLLDKRVVPKNADKLTAGIHDHRLLLPTNHGIQQLATVCFNIINSFFC